MRVSCSQNKLRFEVVPYFSGETFAISICESSKLAKFQTLTRGSFRLEAVPLCRHLTGRTRPSVAVQGFSYRVGRATEADIGAGTLEDMYRP
jgi:hypothetical protein